MYVSPSGECSACCIRNPNSKPFANLKDHSLQEAWNSEGMRQFRLDLLAGKKREETCNTCYRREETEGTSHRMEFNRKFSHLMNKSIAPMKADGTLEKLNWAYWDFRLSNKCNFKCRTCGPQFSTSWQLELNIQRDEKNKIKHTWDAGFRFFTEHGHNVEEIYFAGGEPLIIDEHYELLEWLIAQKKNHVVLNYNTNLSELTYKKWDILNLWRNFKYIHISPSIDHFERAAEYVRKGTHWNKLQNNLNLILKEKNITVRPTITISMLNITHFAKIHQFYMQMGLIRTVNHFAANMLREPDFYHIGSLPAHLKKQVEFDLISYNQKLFRENGERLNCLPLILNELKDDQSHRFSKFIQYSQKIDRVRGENLFEHYPQFATDHEQTSEASC